MANKESSNIYNSKGFCNNISIYCLYPRLFRQFKNVTIIDTNLIGKESVESKTLVDNQDRHKTSRKKNYSIFYIIL